MKKYWRIWLCLVRNSVKTQMATSLASAGYLIGKILRFGFFLGYLLSLFNYLPELKGYTMPQVVLFFLTFNFVDIGAQFLFRGLYGVKYLIDEGDFDKILTQPAHPLFRISFMGVDLLDLITLIPIFFVTIMTVRKLEAPITPQQIFLFVALLLNAFVLAFAFHVVVASISVITQEFEGAIWVYRDLMTLGRFPVSIYNDLLRGIFVTVIPIGVMISFPSRALLGLLSWQGVAYSFLLGATFYAVAQRVWRYSLRNYTSNSV